MKTQTTIKAIKNRFNNIYRVGYCDLQNIMRYEEPVFYNCGVYGWNCDIYVDFGKDLAITTGYRNMAGERIPTEILKKYDSIAVEIIKDAFRKPYEEIKKALEENKENFLNELLNI